jgi:hypothetical protein
MPARMPAASMASPGKTWKLRPLGKTLTWNAVSLGIIFSLSLNASSTEKQEFCQC